MKANIREYRFGVNYTPTQGWWYCWNDFCADAIARDLDSIKLLDADHIRIMLIWPYFHPNPSAVSQAHLERLRALMDLALERELDVCVALFVGWLSGYKFLPPFQSDDSFYDLSRSGGAQELYMKSVAEVVKDYGNFLGFDLGNELNCCWQADDLAEGDIWHNHMMRATSELLLDGVHVNGVDHNPWFRPATFSPANLAKTQRIIALHCWTYFTGALRRSGGDPFKPASVRLLASMAALARSYAGDPQKPVWIQEYGMSEEWTNPADIPRFLQESTVHGIQAGVHWFTWWASHDLDRRYTFDVLEYSLGLVTHDQQVKPQGRAFREIARSYRGRKPVDSVTIPVIPPPATLDMGATWKWLEKV